MHAAHRATALAPGISLAAVSPGTLARETRGEPVLLEVSVIAGK